MHVQLLPPGKVIRRVIRGHDAQKWHLVSSEGAIGEAGTERQFHWWVCGCGESMGEEEVEEPGFKNDVLRIQVAMLNGLDLEHNGLCTLCWPYSLIETEVTVVEDSTKKGGDQHHA